MQLQNVFSGHDVGESKMVILMGGLHIEMVLGAAIGRFLDNLWVGAVS